MYFQIEVGVEGGFVLGKVIHFGLIVKAYKVTKEKYDEEEKKKRRKNRYNEMLRKKFIFDEKRIVWLFVKMILHK